MLRLLHFLFIFLLFKFEESMSFLKIHLFLVFNDIEFVLISDVNE